MGGDSRKAGPGVSRVHKPVVVVDWHSTLEVGNKMFVANMHALEKENEEETQKSESA